MDSSGHLLRRGLAVLRELVSMRRRTFLIAVGGAALYGVATVMSAAVVGKVTDHVIIPRFKDGEVATGTVLVWIGAIIAVAVVKVVGVLIRRIGATITGARVGGMLRTQVVQRYQAVPYEYHQREATGELLAHAGADVDATIEVLHPLPFSTGVIVILLVATGWLVVTDPWLALIGLVVFPSLFGLNVMYQRRVELPAEFAQQQIGAVSTVAHESFDGALVVKALGVEDLESERFRGTTEILRDAKIRVASIRANFDALLDALPSLAVVVLLVVGAWRVDQGAITPGTLVAFVSLFTLITWPLRLIGYVLGELPRAVVGHDRLATVIAEPADPRHSLTAASGNGSHGAPARRPARLDVANLTFAYDPDRPVLQGISFAVEPGQTVAVVGPTGCGKSTLLLVIAGLLPPGGGSVRLDGREVASLTVEELRSKVAIAFQEAFLFGDSIRENVLLGLEDEGGLLVESATLAGADRFVRRLPAGYDTVVGERGATLSGGQRQRVALARALARRPGLLVLDDATSSVDPTTEARILAALETRLDTTTTLIVANRPSTIALADEVVYVEAGHVVAQGPHERLLAEQPGYERLVRAYDLDRVERAG